MASLDEITQDDLLALDTLNRAAHCAAYGFRKRLFAGATVENGSYSLVNEVEQELDEFGPEPTNGYGFVGLDLCRSAPATDALNTEDQARIAGLIQLLRRTDPNDGPLRSAIDAHLRFFGWATKPNPSATS